MLSPDRALANRDIAAFHLPLRASFRELAEFGLPVWNPWLHGGQPILSNPSYGTFYPPGWLVLALPPHYALNVMVLLHAAVAFAGAWRLARHFDCRRGTAALAAVGYVGGGIYLSLLSAYTLLGGLSWLPWVLVWGDEALRRRFWRLPALLAGGALGLQILNGEPSTVMISGLALLALAASAAGRRKTAPARLLVPLLFAVSLAGVQLVPALGRLQSSPRKNLSPEMATVWSMRPARLIEMVFPRFFGDPARAEDGFFIGLKLNDRDYPYIESLYPGLLLTILGVAALLRQGIPRRAAWAACFTAGILLAMGRHGPIYTALRQAIPLLAVIRYPEKFVLLAGTALSMAGILGWQRLLDEREAGRRRAADFPLAVAMVALAVAVCVAWLLWREPRMASWVVDTHGIPNLPQPVRDRAMLFLQLESGAAVGTAAAVVGLLLLCRWRRPSRRLLEASAVLLVAADLWHYGHRLLRTLPASVYRDPPPLAATLLPARDRIYTEVFPSQGQDPISNDGDPGSRAARTLVARLDPYTGLLWGIPYAFDVDIDMMLTGWARKSEAILWAESQPLMVDRYLSAWNVGVLLRPLTKAEQEEAFRTPGASPKRALVNTGVLPRFRFVPRVTFHPDHAAALAGARAGGWRIASNDHWVRSEGPAKTGRFSRPPRLLEVVDEGGTIRLRYRTPEGAFFVAAMTFDEGWQARVDERPAPTVPTAACQLGVALPAGEHQLVLRYREPLVGAGAALSLLALLAAAVGVLAEHCRRNPLHSGEAGA